MENTKEFDFKTVTTFPEMDTFDIQVPTEDGSGTISLKNYIYRASVEDPAYETPKAVVLYFHGIQATSMNRGAYAKRFAENGYDFVAIDSRGCGRTEGLRSHIESLSQHLSDWWKSYDVVRQTYGDDMPIIGNGSSLGGGTIIWMVIQNPKAFAGLVLNAPHTSRPWALVKEKFGYSKNQIDNNMPIYPNSTWIVSSSYDIYKYYPKAYMTAWKLQEAFNKPGMHPCQMTSPPTASGLVALHHLSLFIKEHMKTGFEDKSVNINMHISVGDVDVNISHARLRQILNEWPGDIKEMFVYPGLGHSIFAKSHYLDRMIDKQIEFMGNLMEHLKSKKEGSEPKVDAEAELIDTNS